MKYAVISDIHANLSALERVLEDASDNGAEAVLCLGDLVGYGPQPAEVIRLLRTTTDLVLAGNHDDAATGRLDPSDFIDLAADAIQRHRDALASADIDWLKTLPYTLPLEGAVAVHGDLTDPPAFNYVDSEDAALANFAATDATLVFVGHTHVPCLFLTGQSGAVYRLDAQDFALEPGKRYIVNPGSVGYPRERNGECHSSYVLYDSSEQTVVFRFLPFSVASVMQRGTTPRKTRRRTIAGLVAAGALATGIGVYSLAPSGEVRTVTIEKTVEKTVEIAAPSLVLTNAALTMDGACTGIRANLEIDRRSPPALLTVAFLNARGEEIHRDSKLVKTASSKLFRRPPNATRVLLRVERQAADEAPQILSFAPKAE